MNYEEMVRTCGLAVVFVLQASVFKTVPLYRSTAGSLATVANDSKFTGKSLGRLGSL
jgi:hypothetical protein